MLNLVANGPSGYNLTNSLRFRSSASANLSRTPASAATSTTKGTISLWFKGLGQNQQYLIGKSNGTIFYLYFNSSNQLVWQNDVTNTFITTQVFRDPSAWYHLVVNWDTTQATASNRQSMYINGNQITAFGTTNNLSLNAVVSWFNNDSNVRYIGSYSGVGYFDGYMTEINCIDGQALTPSSFGSTNSLTGVWQPAKYTGTYGTNGFYLNFNSIALTSGSNTGLGKDNSGNGNYWNTNNISVTAGTTYDAMTDVPTLTSATVGNYCVMNPLYMSGTATPTNGNLTVSQANNQSQVAGTFGMSSGKWYYEHTVTAVGGEMPVGIGSAPATGIIGTTSTQYGYYSVNGQKYNNNTGASYGATFTTNDIIGVAYDADAGSLTFYKNGTTQGTAFTGITGTMFPLAATRTSGGQNTSDLNFGQRPFSYTPPTGFVALNTYNLPTSTIVQGNKYMDATTYTGDGTNKSITNTASFYPDLVWIKNRSSGLYWNVLFDSVRGAGNQLSSNQTDAELASASNVAGKVSAFNSNGFAVTAGSSSILSVNGSSNNYVGWQWQAGQGSTSSNTNGSITSTVSVNTSAGFSVVTYTGNVTGGATVGHGLGVAPSMIITKNRDTATAWWTYHKSLGATQYIVLNTTAAAVSSISAWNNTQPNANVFYLGASSPSNANQCVAYCWAEIAGFSKFGSYVGNGSTDGTFVFTNFQPKYVMLKRTDTGGAGYDWYILDSVRMIYNTINSIDLKADTSEAEGASTIPAPLDILSNGFKIRTSSVAMNASGGTYIFMAFASNPFKNANAR